MFRRRFKTSKRSGIDVEIQTLRPLIYSGCKHAKSDGAALDNTHRRFYKFIIWERAKTIILTKSFKSEIYSQ